MRYRRRVLGIMAALTLVTTSAIAVASSATANPTSDNVTLCHRTNSNKNPYVKITVDPAGAYNGHAGHTGPVWDPTLKAQHIKWGDIIPAFDYAGAPGGHYSGQNLTTEGLAILANGCNIPGPPPVQEFGSLTVVKAVDGVATTGGFTVQVTCDDDVSRPDLVFPATGGSQTITDIEAGSTCTVVELGVGAWVVTYSPVGANTVGVFVDANLTTTVTVTNTFTPPVIPVTPITPVTPQVPQPLVQPAPPPVVQVSPETVVSAAAAVQASPSFTG